MGTRFGVTFLALTALCSCGPSSDDGDARASSTSTSADEPTTTSATLEGTGPGSSSEGASGSTSATESSGSVRPFFGGPTICAAPPDHCALYCPDGTVCPDGMSCRNSFCHYDEDMPPVAGDPDYPPADEDLVCPEGTFGPNGLVPQPYYWCAPPCDGMGTDAPCPNGATGTAMGLCVFNPETSGQPC